MLDAEAVRQYNLMGDSLTTLAQFPKTSNLLARRIVHSEHHKAWLIFFSAKTAKSAQASSSPATSITLFVSPFPPPPTTCCCLHRHCESMYAMCARLDCSVFQVGRWCLVFFHPHVLPHQPHRRGQSCGWRF